LTDDSEDRKIRRMESEGSGPQTPFGLGEEPSAAEVAQSDRQKKRDRPSGSTRESERVVAALEELRKRGFQIVEGIGEEDDGAVAHLVSGPTGVFLVEAKSGRCTDEYLSEARRRAAELFHELDTWVTPVVCPTGRAWQKPRRREKVWIVRRSQLAKWIAGRRNPVLESEHLPDITAER
jgi:hypothetical protein